MSLIIRNYSEKDYEGVINLHIKADSHASAFDEKSFYDKDLNDSINHYTENEGALIVGEFYEKIVAIGGFKRIKRNTALIQRMQVFPDFLNYDFAAQILHNLEVRARVMGYKKLIIRGHESIKIPQNVIISGGFSEKKSSLFRSRNTLYYQKNI